MKINPFQFYYNIAFNEELEIILSSYYNNKELLDDGFEFLKEYNYYFKDEIIIDGDNPTFAISIVKKTDYFRQKLKEEKLNCYKVLSGDKDELINYFNKLNSIFIKIEGLETNEFTEILIEHLKEIIIDLKIQYSYLVGHHNLFNRIRQVNEIMSFFQCKELPYSFFKDLYNKTLELDLVDDIVTTEQVFIDVFVTDFHDGNNEIVFIKSNYIIAYYLKEIECFFNNFNAITIEKSKAFFNKQNKPLRSNDLYTALSRGKGKNNEYLEKINQGIRILKSKYL